MTKSVTIERTFAAPIAMVWSMWTTPEHFASWYGPKGAEIPVSKIDLTVGGKRHVCMSMNTPKGPMKMWFTGVYEEITPTTRLVYTEAMSNEAGDILSPQAMGMPEGHPMNTRVIVELTDAGDTTKLVLTHEGVPADSPGAMGWKMALDKLASRLTPAA